MKLLNVSFENIGIFRDGFSINLTASDKVVDTSSVNKIYNTIYTQNVIAITGANASGKTTLLKLLRVAFNIVVNNKGLDSVSLPSGVVCDGTKMQVIFYNNNTFYKLESIIGVSISEAKEKKYYYKGEKIYSKLQSDVLNKLSAFDFPTTPILDRKDISSELNFLKPEDSIVSNYSKDSLICMDTIMDTNINFYYSFGRATMPFVNLFDNSIEHLDSDKEDLNISFKGGDTVCVRNTIFETGNYLSSGTIKGTNIFSMMALIMKCGGYLIIDEIENHLHKKLVQIIIEFFTDKDINKYGATLIFSTHYSEILDSIDRKDNIYVLLRDKYFVCKAERYSNMVNRNDVKKSEILLSNFIEGTSPSYENIQSVKEELCRYMK